MWRALSDKFARAGGILGCRIHVVLGFRFSVVRQRSQAAGIVTGFGLRTGFAASRLLPAALAFRFLIVLFRFTVALSQSMSGGSKTTFLSDR